MWCLLRFILSLALILLPGCRAQPIPPAPFVDNVHDNPLGGLRLRYLIGTDNPGSGKEGYVTEVGYDVKAPVQIGPSIKYGNLFDETNSGKLGPYLQTSDTAAEYKEGQIDPRGPGWNKNLREQFERAKRQGFRYIELDNPDAYSSMDVVNAVAIAADFQLGVIAKNPLLVEGDQLAYVGHQNIFGIIVERGAGGPQAMHDLRIRAMKTDLPVWFVFFGRSDRAARNTAKAVNYKNMYVTHSYVGEYGNAVDIK